MEQRHASALIPYRIQGSDEIEFFVQKRDLNARISPGLFGLFGGGIEVGETADDCIKREIKEELGFELSDYEFFKKYEFSVGERYVFYTNVDKDFEKMIVVMEGEYGKFLTKYDLLNIVPTTNRTKIIIREFCDYIRGCLLRGF